MQDTLSPDHYVVLDKALCNGCVICMKACPTKAIRVRENRKARIVGICIYCGECIRVCPKQAIKAVTMGEDITELAPYSIMTVSPVIHGQFGDNIMPNTILMALRKAFRFVYDQGYSNELCNLATEIYLDETRLSENAVWPLISPNCPVVNRIIAYRYQSLLKNLLPIITPRELSAKYLKHVLNSENLYDPSSIGIYSLTSCAAEMTSIREPILLSESNLDGAIGINEVYLSIRNIIKEDFDNIMLHRSSGIGIGWGISGGEVYGLNSGKYLAVSGIQETIKYLEKIDMGLLNDIEYVEFRACREGCIGGPMAVTDRYQAKQTIQRLKRMYGTEKRIVKTQIQDAYSKGWFFSDIKRAIEYKKSGSLSFSEITERQRQIDKVSSLLPGKECGACGSPDCGTFAEDVVDGSTSIASCPFAGDMGDLDIKNLTGNRNADNSF